MTTDVTAETDSAERRRGTDDVLAKALDEWIQARTNSRTTETGEVAEELLRSLEDLLESEQDPTLSRVLRRVLGRSVGEFFTSKSMSTQLPEDLIRFARSDPSALDLGDVDLPDVSLTDVLADRRSVRDFAKGPLEKSELSGVLRMAAAKNGSEDGYGTRDLPLVPYPSIGGLDSNVLGVIINNVEGVEPGYYRYDAIGHGLVPLMRGDMRLILQRNTFETEWIFFAPVVFVLNNCQSKVSWKYMTRGYRISHMDQGALLQNLYLSATAHKLGACAVAGFLDDDIDEALGNAGTDQFVSALVAMGRPLEYGRPDLE
ncbi:SagB/ThcOx family dehydrogenase [Brevibacterium atlanticum]|uniref:SagB/ThcOx family dehydrogenase n=1 Tax=Brevibacterium atlanticum TaxID=2697563 RepID=UPI001420B42B|nr:SagB/ThcOx family dehydrogenase [Brevibacterium atlanticum]